MFPDRVDATFGAEAAAVARRHGMAEKIGANFNI